MDYTLTGKCIPTLVMKKPYLTQSFFRCVILCLCVCVYVCKRDRQIEKSKREKKGVRK